jgi:hypothetical protein
MLSALAIDIGYGIAYMYGMSVNLQFAELEQHIHVYGI